MPKKNAPQVDLPVVDDVETIIDETPVELTKAQEDELDLYLSHAERLRKEVTDIESSIAAKRAEYSSYCEKVYGLVGQRPIEFDDGTSIVASKGRHSFHLRDYTPKVALKRKRPS